MINQRNFVQIKDIFCFEKFNELTMFAFAIDSPNLLHALCTHTRAVIINLLLVFSASYVLMTDLLVRRFVSDSAH